MMAAKRDPTRRLGVGWLLLTVARCSFWSAPATFEVQRCGSWSTLAGLNACFFALSDKGKTDLQ